MADRSNWWSVLTSQDLAVIVTVLGIVGSGAWYTGSSTATLSEKLDTVVSAVAQERADRAAALELVRAAAADRMNRSDADQIQRLTGIASRLDSDEKDIKTAAQFVSTVDLRLTRIEAQLDFVVAGIKDRAAAHR